MSLTDDSETWSLIEQIMSGLTNVTNDSVLHEAQKMHHERELSDKELKDVKRVLNQGLIK